MEVLIRWNLLHLHLGCGLIYSSRKGPTGGWVERREKQPTTIQSFHLPLKVGCLRRSPQCTSAVAPSSDRRGCRGSSTCCPSESEGGWTSNPRGGAWGKAPIQSHLLSVLPPRLPPLTQSVAVFQKWVLC